MEYKGGVQHGLYSKCMWFHLLYPETILIGVPNILSQPAISTEFGTKCMSKYIGKLYVGCHNTTNTMDMFQNNNYFSHL